MRVFVTGASGGIGSAVLPELFAAGHEVVGLARSDAAASRVAALGAEPLLGDLTTVDTLRAAADDADGVVHLAFSNDFTRVAEGTAEERAAVEALGAALEGTGKPFVFASGTPAVPGRASTELDPTPTDGPMGARGLTAAFALGLADRGVRPAAVRLPRSVHQGGDRYGFASMLIEAARRTGVSGYVGDGTQRWPAVHRLDAARLFRLVLEQAQPGEQAHAVADEGDTMRSIAETIGRALGLPAEPVPAESFGFLGTIFGVDQPSSSALTRERFGWQPTHPSLLEDLAAGDYPA
ncbi:SDR family oxidoreductase [Luteimicrobium sp. DT211]|uniref:SDR family oxidoreductase n=1 Tax=Luteimicrobium sp. DT211 TaxID=3393412 RepID=UPI003CE78302